MNKNLKDNLLDAEADITIECTLTKHAKAELESTIDMMLILVLDRDPVELPTIVTNTNNTHSIGPQPIMNTVSLNLVALNKVHHFHCSSW